ncbi:PI-PLC domain-containing protein [Emydomyces testavorans]|uniref:PI-PLC domain-containing protein n=1 Tax=Emydomyces testavorans TaxID=2070801 RepID=A0AAF0DBG2_9EURO|nr:PI-PLC domain-containing protein [Emydomyces testavorans]
MIQRSRASPADGISAGVYPSLSVTPLLWDPPPNQHPQNEQFVPMAPIRRVFSYALAVVTIFSQPLLGRALPAAEFPTAIAPSDQSANVSDISARNAAGARPFYAIAHRVLMDYGVRDALKHGANAIEIDMTARKDGWYADHDGTPTSAGDTAEKIFKTIAEQRQAGKNILFVWLDLKNPNYNGDANSKTSIEGLRTLARMILEPASVKVLYGFYGRVDNSRAYKIIRDNLNENEAIAVDGDADQVQEMFQTGGPSDTKKRVMSNGLFNPALKFGDCESGSGICVELRKAAASKAFGKVFGWTVAENNSDQATAMMSKADVDGIIYGFVATHYYDHANTRASLRIITDWLDENKDKRYLAKIGDQPW